MHNSRMFVEVITESGLRKNRRLIVIKCDVCGQFRKTSYCASKEIKAKTKHTFCSRKCQVESQHSGAIRQQNTELFLKKYGVVTPLVLEKSISAKKLCIDSTIKKTKQTLQKRYNVDNPMKIENIAAKQQNSIRIKRDGFHHLETEECLEKRKITCIQRFGVDHPMRSAQVKDKFPFKEVWLKSHYTKKKNGTYIQSKSEKKFHAWLIKIFGKENVKTGVVVNGWSIDFQIKIQEFECYIQYDGVYWHGLDASENVIKVRKGARARRIEMVFERDKLQCRWFSEHGLFLLRTTDKEFERFIWQARKKNKLKMLKI